MFTLPKKDTYNVSGLTVYSGPGIGKINRQFFIFGREVQWKGKIRDFRHLCDLPGLQYQPLPSVPFPKNCMNIFAIKRWEY
jgi:hypothetical protein